METKSTPSPTSSELKSALTGFENSVEGEKSKIMTWFKKEWAHIPTWAGVVAMMLKLWGKL